MLRGGMTLAALALGCQRSHTGPPGPITGARAEEARGAASGRPGEVSRSAVLGTNLDGFQDYSMEWPLIDAFKRSRAWISGVKEGPWEDKRPLSLDADGWVKRLESDQVARTVMFWADKSVHPVGDYTVTFDGDGDLDFWNTAEKVSSGPGRMVVRVKDAPDGIAMFLTRTNPDNPLRNIRLLLPGSACASDHARSCHSDAECGGARCEPLASARWSYHPDFLSGLRPYGVIRFMNWMGTNGSTERTWSDRPKPTDARWTIHGVPVEVLVELSNELGADPWFCLPLGADDDYFKNFAAYVKEHSKSKRIYIELSNEIWNSGFQQASSAEEQGKAQGLSRDRFEARLRWYSKRAVRMFGIFEGVFGGKDRLVRVLGSQAVNPWVSETVLSYEDASEHTDALAIAPYFGGELGTSDSPVRVSELSIDGLMKELAGGAVERAAKAMKEQARVARKFEVKLVAYEGGQHLVGVGPPMEDPRLNLLFDAANRDPRMKATYLGYLSEWRRAGGDVFVHFSAFGGYSRWGRWGAVERVGQPRAQAPKLDALLTFAEAGGNLPR